MKWPTLLQVISIFQLVLPESLGTGFIFNATAGNIYEGCFQLGTPSDLQPPSSNYELSKMTPYKCVILCSVTKRKLAGLTSGALCVCSDTVAGPSLACNQACAADSSLNCGGPGALGIFNLSMLLRNKPQLQFSSNPTFLQEGQYQAMTVNETTSYRYQLAYKATGFLNATNTDLIFGNSYSYRPTAWGSDVQLTVVVLGKIRQEFQETVKVSSPLNDSSINCPQFVTAGHPFTCTGRLNLGKEVNMTWDLGGLSGSMNFADPLSWYIGEPVPRWTIPDPSVHSLDGFVILTAGVSHPVVVYAWEMNVQKQGSLDFVILRPTCRAGTTYCPVSSSCCEISGQFSAEQCNEETSFCGTSTIGVNSGNCSSGDVNTPVSLFKNYTVYHKFNFSVDVGHNIEILEPSKRFEYLPGDIIGWMKTSSSATLAVDTSHGEYIVVESITSLPQPTSHVYLSQQLNKTHGTVLFAGIASKPTEFVVNITAPSTHGERNISFAHKTREETLTVTRPVSVLYPVGNVSFTGATNSCSIYGPLDEPFNISITFHFGTKARVAWKVNNFSVASSPYETLGILDKTTWQQNFTFPSIDEYPLIVLVTNGVSGKLLTATIFIQEKISGLKAFKWNSTKTSYQGFETKFNVSISTGTNVTYKWYFGDGSDVVVTTESTVNHIYHKFGTINTTVEATNMVSSVNFSFLVNVSNPVEITVPPFAVFNISTNITCKLAERGPEMYTVVLQVDNDSLVSSNCNTIQYVFTPGLHDIHCYIHKTVVLHSEISLFAVEPITGLSILDIPPLAINTSYDVEANITSGNNVSYEWKIGSDAYDAFINSSYSIPFKTLGDAGRVNLTVTAINAVSKKSAYRIVTVQEPIGKVKVISSSNPAKTNSTVYFRVNLTQGTEVNYTVNINTTDYKDLQSTPKFTHVFSQEGSYIIFVSSTNLISSSNTTYPIIIQDPVIPPLEITCPSISREDGTCIVLTKKQLQFVAKIPYATSPTFEWQWGDDVTNTDRRPNISVSITSSQNKNFSDFKTYTIVVVAKNNVSNVTKELNVATLHEVTGFTFETPEAVAVNTNFVVDANILQGSNVSYSYDAGDNREEKINVTNQTTSWNYTNVGVYQIKGIASNLLSLKRFRRVIVVQRKITGVNIEVIKSLQTNNVTNIKWNVTGGTNVTSIVRFGDNTSTTISYSQCQFDDLTSTYSCNVKKSWSKADIYEVNIEARNLLSVKGFGSTKVTVQDPVRNFEVEIDKSFKSKAGEGKFYVNEEIPLVFHALGTSVKFIIYRNDGTNDTESPLTPNSTDIKYYTAGETFKPSFKAYNDISERRLREHLTISIIRRPEPVEIKDLKISAKPVKFHETTKFEIDYGDGAVFKCSIYFGDGNDEDILEKDLKQGTSYKYKEAKNFKATLTCWNTEGSRNKKTESTDVFVHVPIDGFKLLKSSIDAIYQEKIDIAVSWQKGSHVNVFAVAGQNRHINAEIIHYSKKYTNGSGKVTLPGNYFSAPGHYVVRVNASNAVSRDYKELTVHIYEKIDGTQVIFNPYVSVRYGLKAYVTVDYGSEMQVTWNFGDGTSSNFSNCTWKQTCSFDHTYYREGKFVIKVKVKNDVSEGENNGTIEIQHPIVRLQIIT
ncbi:polycystin-1-like [Dendronephthya gigantea]|uniref:polycystin-1-like n=1 Tax=Dendronephthya gigantea TaxID=151771 RepID=UPI00106ACA33|nr:polycystin-1-like [Dendronephthya gigantea]